MAFGEFYRKPGALFEAGFSAHQRLIALAQTSIAKRSSRASSSRRVNSSSVSPRIAVAAISELRKEIPGHA
jgi:hypothetical protein